MMWTLILINAGVFWLELGLSPRQLQYVTNVLGIVPARYLDGGLRTPFPAGLWLWPFVTHMFLHGSWLHILGNMWTLWIFGDNVEDRMGPVRFLVFYLLCGLAAALTHMLLHPTSTVPVIGASGAISGVLAAYLLLYPTARIIVMMPLLFWPVFFDLPAILYMGIWLLTQVFSGSAALVAGVGDEIAWWAHIGGFAAGLVLCPWMIVRRRPRRRMYADEYGLEGAWVQRPYRWS